MKNLCLLLLLLGGILVSAGEPLFKIGVVTDTHVKAGKESCQLLKETYRIFKSDNVDMIVNAGDIANVYNVQAYKNYRDTVNEVYTGVSKRPVELFVYANHDRIGREKEDVLDVFKDVKKHLQIPNDPIHIQEFRGYYFLVVHQFIDMKVYSELLREVAKKAGNRTFFVIDHVPAYKMPGGTGSSATRRELLKKYPQAVVICGHLHRTLFDERAIWQENYTEVSAGALYEYGIILEGVPRQRFPGDMFLIVDVYKDKLVFRRFSASTGKEYKADAPWCIPLPFDQKTAPYRVEKRLAEEKTPEFAPGSSIKIQNTGKLVSLRFPAASGDVLSYKMEFYRKRDSKWQLFATQEIAGNAVTPENMRKPNMTAAVDTGFFEPGEENKVCVTPQGFFGKRGKAIESTFSVNNRYCGKVVFECTDPMKELKFKTGLKGGKDICKGNDGFYLNTSSNSRLLFPENIWTGKKGTTFRFTVDMHTIQGNDAWSLVLRNPQPLKNATHRIDTPAGDSGLQRYVITFSKARETFKYYLLIREGGKGKIKFNYVKVERLD